MEQSAAAAVVAAVESRCRLCFSADDLTCPLFHSEGDPSREMIDIILECTSIQITLEDDYPSRVCEKCVETLDKFHHYRRRCLENDRILKSQRSNSARVRVKQEQLDDDEPGSPAAHPPSEQQDQQAQQVKQEDPGGSSILRSILLQVREAGRAPSTASAELEPELDVSEQPEHKQEEPPVDEVDAAVAPASLLQQMLLQQQGFSRELNQSPGQAGPSHPGPSPSLLKRMLLEGGGAQSPLEGPSHRHDEQKQQSSAAQSPQQPPQTNHHHHPQQQQHQQHDENHNEEHSETPLASQLRAILLQHRAAAAAAAAASAGSAASASTGAATPGEKPEVSYLRSLFLRNDSDGNEDSDSESAVAAAAAVADEPNRELLFSMFQELRARNELNSDDTDDSAEDRAFDYRIPAVRRRSSESTTTTNAESRKRRRLDFTCLLCGRPFLNRSKLVIHMRTHIAPPSESPSIAGASGSGSGSSGSAAAAAAVVAAAAAAAAGERAAENNAEDDEESRQIELLERRSYACYICGADQNNLQQLKEHLLLAHQDRIRSRGRAKERPKPLISCNFCSRQFRSQFAYGEHLRTHTGERPFPCDQCDKRFPRRFQLLGHLYNVHKQSWVADESKAKFVKK